MFRDHRSCVLRRFARNLRSPGPEWDSRTILAFCGLRFRFRSPERPSASASTTSGSRAPGSFPDGVIPFEAFPSPAAVPRHRGRCPLAVVPDLRSPRPACPVKNTLPGSPSSGPRPQGLAPQGESVASTRRCRRRTPDASMGFLHCSRIFDSRPVAFRAALPRRQVDGAWPTVGIEFTPHFGRDRRRDGKPARRCEMVRYLAWMPSNGFPARKAPVARRPDPAARFVRNRRTCRASKKRGPCR